MTRCTSQLETCKPISHRASRPRSARRLRLRRDRRGLAPAIIVAVVVVVVAAGVVGGLFATGLIKLGGGGSGGASFQFNVTFSETGILRGGIWTVMINGGTESSATNQISFSLPNGSYSYSVNASGYATATPAGAVTVHGATAGPTLAFTKLVTYALTFSETGLATGSPWRVALNGGNPETSTITTLIFSEPNQTYRFSASASGYSAMPATGSVVINGSAAAQAIVFTSSGGGGNGQPYSQAKPIADAAAASHDSSAQLVTAFATVVQSSFLQSTSGIGNASCPWTGASSITYEATTSSYASGKSAGWVFIYRDATASRLLYVQVAGSSGSFLGTVSGPGCSLFGTGIAYDPMPTNVIDSGQATAAVASAASGFLSAHPAANAYLYLVSSGTGELGNFTFHSPALWQVSYTTCSPSAGRSGSGSEFSAMVNASNGAVISSTGVISISCSESGHGPAAGSPISSGAATSSEPAAMPVLAAGRLDR